MRKKLIAAGMAITFGLSLAGCSNVQSAQSEIRASTVTPTPYGESEGIKAHCNIEKLGSIVLSPRDQALLLDGNAEEQQKVQATLRGEGVAPHLLNIATHSKKELKNNRQYITRIAAAIARIVAPKVRPLAENTKYTITNNPDTVKQGYIEVTASTERCIRLPGQGQQDAGQPISPLV